MCNQCNDTKRVTIRQGKNLESVLCGACVKIEDLCIYCQGSGYNSKGLVCDFCNGSGLKSNIEQPQGRIVIIEEGFKSKREWLRQCHKIYDRTGKAGFCAQCPRDDSGNIFPEKCINKDMEDHNKKFNMILEWSD